MSTTTVRPQRAGADPMRHPEGASPHVRGRRAVWLLGMTVLVPGSAQIVAGDRRLGRAGLRGWLAVLAVLAVLGLLALVQRSLLLGLMTSSWSLLLATVVTAVLALGWGYLVLDAWRLGRRPGLSRQARRTTAALTAACLLVTTGPLLYGAVLMSAQRDLVQSVFGGGARSGAVDGRYNILLLGGDAGTDRTGLRPDSIQLASVDADTGATVLIGLPRNLANLPFPEDSPMHAEFPDGFTAEEGLLNAVYTYASQRPELYPESDDPGAEATKEAVEGATGLSVQYSVLVDMAGFEQLVDAMGGVQVTALTRVPIGGGRTPAGDPAPITGYIEPGSQRMDGYTALWFARSREGASDYERMARQRCVMSAMVAQLDPPTVLLRFQEMAAASSQILRTDIPQTHLGELADLALDARDEPLVSLQLVPPLVEPGNADFDQVRQLVADTVAAAEQAGEEPVAEPAAPEGSAADGGSGDAGTAEGGSPDDDAAAGGDAVPAPEAPAGPAPVCEVG